jgi:hypothetical protein
MLKTVALIVSAGERKGLGLARAVYMLASRNAGAFEACSLPPRPVLSS